MNNRISKRLADRVFRDIVGAYLRNFGFDLSYMRYVLDERPHYRDGRIVRGKPKGWAAGSAADGGIVYINPDLGSVFQYYGMPQGTNPEQFCRQIMGHEIAHEIWREHASPEFQRKIIKEAHQKGFQTPYLKTVPEKQYDEELFCEYLSHLNSYNRRLNMNIRKNFSRVVVYNGQYNFDRLKRFVKEDLGDDLETDPSKLLGGVSDRSKRALMEQRSKLRNQTIVDMADPSSPRYDAKWQARIYNDTTDELPVAQALNESLKALRKKGKKLRGLDLPKEDRRVLLGDAYKVAKEDQEVYNTLLARGVASENMPHNLKKK
jgi:hypothetical protein